MTVVIDRAILLDEDGHAREGAREFLHALEGRDIRVWGGGPPYETVKAMEAAGLVGYRAAMSVDEGVYVSPDAQKFVGYETALRKLGVEPARGQVQGDKMSAPSPKVREAALTEQNSPSDGAEPELPAYRPKNRK